MKVGPLPRFSPEWVLACDDGTPEFRLAVALGHAHRDLSVGQPAGGDHPGARHLGPVGDEELVSLMAPITADRHAAWRGEKIPMIQEPEGKKKPTAKQVKDRERLEAPYPLTLVEALEVDNAQWQSFGWSQPPGSQWVQYRRPRDTVALIAPPSRGPAQGDEPADVILLSLTSSSGSAGLLPSIVRTLPRVELIHDELVRMACRDGQEPPEELTGRSRDRSPLVGHRHAHVLPVDLDQDGHLDQVILWAKMGFSREAQAPVGGLRRTFTKGGKSALHLALAGRALQSSTLNWPGDLGRILGTSRLWFSETPFVPPRFVKKSGAHSPLFGIWESLWIGNDARRGEYCGEVQ